jgi:hypothetical protein
MPFSMIVIAPPPPPMKPANSPTSHPTASSWEPTLQSVGPSPKFRQWAKPQFQRKSAGSFQPRDRHVSLSSDGAAAWFVRNV